MMGDEMQSLRISKVSGILRMKLCSIIICSLMVKIEILG